VRSMIRWRRPLRVRQLSLVMVALISALILPFIGAALFVIMRLSAAERVTNNAQNLGIARAFSSEIDRQLLTAESALQALATSPQLHDGDLAAFYRQSVAVADQHRARIVLVDAKGHRVFDTVHPFGTPQRELGQASLARAAVASQKTQISDLFSGSTTHEPLVAIHVPVIEDGPTRYVLVMAFHPERLSRLFAEQHVPDQWTIAVVDRNGTVIGRNRALDQFLGQPVTGDLKSAMDAASEGSALRHTNDGIEVYTAFTRSTLSGWTVAFDIPRAIIEGSIAAFANRIWHCRGGDDGLVRIDRACGRPPNQPLDDCPFSCSAGARKRRATTSA
jgi:Cache domain